jgi:hypothetical protein
MRRFRSYDPDRRTYLGFDGDRRERVHYLWEACMQADGLRSVGKWMGFQPAHERISRMYDGRSN